MLRLALIENLRRASAGTGADRLARKDRGGRVGGADAGNGGEEADDLVLGWLAEMAKSDPPIAVRSSRSSASRLSRNEPGAAFRAQWLEQRLADRA